MSWDASLTCSCCGSSIFDQNYTHNCNRMVEATLHAAGIDDDRSWWAQLDGLSGLAGANFLGLIVAGLRADPAAFRAMNPDNKWGSYDSLLLVLEAMAEASRKHPSATWDASG